MKSFIILSFTFFAFVANSFSQLSANNVPEEVKKSFAKKYPNMYVYEWEFKKKTGEYEAEFIQNGLKYEALYTPVGKWVKTARELKKEDLPQVVWEAIAKSDYAGWKVDDIEEVSSPGHSLFYEIEMKLQKQKVYLYFLADGTAIHPD